MATSESEFGGNSDAGMFGNVDRGAPVTPYQALVSYRQSAPRGIRTDSRGVAIPLSPKYGTSTRV
jgi:hypothetical protein